MQLVPPEGSIVHARTSFSSVSTRRGDLQAAGLNLLDFPKLPLALIWQRIRQLPMCDRCALLATSKAALGTFGEITDHMGRLQLTFDDDAGAFPGLNEGTFPGLNDEGALPERTTDCDERPQLSPEEGMRVSDLTPRQEGGGPRVSDHAPAGQGDHRRGPGRVRALKVLS